MKTLIWKCFCSSMFVVTSFTTAKTWKQSKWLEVDEWIKKMWCIYLQLNSQFSSIQSISPVWHFVTPWTAACQASLSITNCWSSPKSLSIESVMPSNHLILCCLLPLLPSIFPSIRVFSNESALPIRSSKYWSFSFNIRLSNEYSRLISFRIDWFDLLAVQGTLKSLSSTTVQKHHFFGT